MYEGSCRVNSKTHPVKDKVELFTATKNVGNWVGLCTYLGASNSIMEKLKFSIAQDIIKAQECLTDVFNTVAPDWERVIGVVGNFPIGNPREACDIAERYADIKETECRCIISAHESSKEDMKGYETGIDKE